MSTKDAETVRVTFFASFPDIMSAIKEGSDGARIQLDIPESDLDDFAPARKWKRRLLKATLELAD